MTATLLAQFSLLDTVLVALRLVTALGAVLIGYLLTGPLVRLLARLTVRKPLPRWSVRLFRMMGGILAGLLVWLYLPLGLGTGGWGFGPGPGGSPGAGPGTGPHQAKGTENGKKPGVNGEKALEKPKKETLSIEMLGGKRYPDEERYYLLHRKEPAVTIAEVERYVKENRDRLEKVQIWFAADSVSELHGAVRNLKALAHENKLSVALELPK